MVTPYRPPPPRKVELAFKRLEKAMKKAEAAEKVFKMTMQEATTWQNVHKRACDRLIKDGGLTRARGRKALCVGEYSPAASRG